QVRPGDAVEGQTHGAGEGGRTGQSPTLGNRSGEADLQRRRRDPGGTEPGDHSDQVVGPVPAAWRGKPGGTEFDGLPQVEGSNAGAAPAFPRRQNDVAFDREREYP